MAPRKRKVSELLPVQLPQRPDQDGNDYRMKQTETQQEAAENFVHLAKTMYATGARMTAKSMCLLAHYASAAGACHPVSSVARGPDSHTGNYQKKVDRTVLRETKTRWGHLVIKTPVNYGWGSVRRQRKVHVRPVHEELYEIMNKNELAQLQVAQTLQQTELPQVWHENAVVKEAKHMSWYCLLGFILTALCLEAKVQQGVSGVPLLYRSTVS